MNKYIALLRGINVGGHKKVLMKDLVILFKKNGLTDVVSYIQSGNVVFSSKITSSIVIQNTIEKSIEEKFGFHIPVQIITHKEINWVLSNNPYYSEDRINQLYVCFLEKKPENKYIKIFESLKFENDLFFFNNKYVFLCYEIKANRSRLSNNLIENKLNVIATSRNWKTVKKLCELINN